MAMPCRDREFTEGRASTTRDGREPFRMSFRPCPNGARRPRRAPLRARPPRVRPGRGGRRTAGRKALSGPPGHPDGARFPEPTTRTDMATFTIRHRWTRCELAAIEAPTYARALEWAARRGMGLADVDLAGTDLRGAFLAGGDLRGAGLAGADLCGGYLRRADLRGADLRGARLAHAFLGAADLRRADLREADLSRADLRGTSLVGADLRGTILTGACLDGTLCDWRWSAIPAELLRQKHNPSADVS